MHACEVSADRSQTASVELRRQVGGQVLSLLEQLQTGPSSAWLELNLTMPQLKMLYVVEALGPSPMSHLASSLGISDSTATSIISRLVDQKLADREHDRRDRRIVRVTATPAGRSLLRELRSASIERLERILEHLDLAELELCALALGAIGRAAAIEALGTELRSTSIETTVVLEGAL